MLSELALAISFPASPTLQKYNADGELGEHADNSSRKSPPGKATRSPMTSKSPPPITQLAVVTATILLSPGDSIAQSLEVSVVVELAIGINH